MTLKTDCLIIGGGFIGMMCARELQREGISVTVVDKNHIGREASWAGGGILFPLYAWTQSPGVNVLATHSQDMYPQLCDELTLETGINPEHQKSGLLLLDADEPEKIQVWASQYDQRAQAVSKTEVNSLEQHLTTKTHSAFRFPDIAQVRNPRLLQAMYHSLKNGGVQFVEECEVTGFTPSGDRITSVTTTTDTIEAGNIVLTAGAWTAQLLETLNIQASIFPVKGQMILFKAQPDILHHVVLDQQRYLIPRKDGHILCGSTLEYRDFDKSPSNEALDTLRQVAVKLLPELKHAPVIKHWAGLRPGTDRPTPIISNSLIYNNLFINSGHFRNGIVCAPASAEILADLVLERSPSLDSSPFQLNAN